MNRSFSTNPPEPASSSQRHDFALQSEWGYVHIHISVHETLPNCTVWEMWLKNPEICISQNRKKAPPC